MIGQAAQMNLFLARHAGRAEAHLIFRSVKLKSGTILTVYTHWQTTRHLGTHQGAAVLVMLYGYQPYALQLVPGFSHTDMMRPVH